MRFFSKWRKTKNNINYSDIVYLDDGFIYAAYEKDTGKTPITELSRETSSSVAIAMGVNAGIGDKTVRRYRCPLIKILNEFLETNSPDNIVDVTEFSDCDMWINGILRTGEFQHTKSDNRDKKLLGQEYTIDLYHGKRRFQLLYKQEAFYSGYSIITDFGYFTKMALAFKVNLYGRIVCSNNDLETTYIIPYIILQTKDTP